MRSSGWNCRRCSRGDARRDDALVAACSRNAEPRSPLDRPADTVYLLRALVSDFNGLADVSAEASRLERCPSVGRQEGAQTRTGRRRAEERMLREIFELEARLGDDDRRDVALLTLRDRLSKLSRTAAERGRHARAQPGAAGAAVDCRRRVGARAGSGVSGAAGTAPPARAMIACSPATAPEGRAQRRRTWAIAHPEVAEDRPGVRSGLLGGVVRSQIDGLGRGVVRARGVLGPVVDIGPLMPPSRTVGGIPIPTSPSTNRPCPGSAGGRRRRAGRKWART